MMDCIEHFGRPNGSRVVQRQRCVKGVLQPAAKIIPLLKHSELPLTWPNSDLVKPTIHKIEYMFQSKLDLSVKVSTRVMDHCVS